MKNQHLSQVTFQAAWHPARAPCERLPGSSAAGNVTCDSSQQRLRGGFEPFWVRYHGARSTG